MSDPFIGEIRMLPYTYAPREWAWCNGQLLPLMQFQALFSVIGTTYGGDGRTTFRLPNLSGRTPMGWGNGPGLTPRVIGQMTGTESVSLVAQQMPSHDHTAQIAQEKPDSEGPAASSWPALADRDKQGGGVEFSWSFVSPQGGLTAMSTQSMATYGSSQGHENRQPSLGVNFCIALDGYYPVHN